MSKLRILQGGFVDVAEYDFYSGYGHYGGVYDDYDSCGCGDGDYGSGFEHHIDGVGFGYGYYGSIYGRGYYGAGHCAISDNGFEGSASE